MPKFDSGAAVESLDYDFTAHGGGSGTIPEPTGEQVEKFIADLTGLFAQYRDVLSVARGKTTPSAEEIGALLEQVGEIKASDLTDSLVDIAAELCGGQYDEESDTWIGGQPTHDDIAVLPHRVKQAFIGWLSGAFSPEGGTPATSR